MVSTRTFVPSRYNEEYDDNYDDSLSAWRRFVKFSGACRCSCSNIVSSIPIAYAERVLKILCLGSYGTMKWVLIYNETSYEFHNWDKEQSRNLPDLINIM